MIYNFLSIFEWFRPRHAVLGNIPGTEVYKDMKLYKDVSFFLTLKLCFLNI